MRALILALIAVGAFGALMATGAPASAQDRTTICRPLAERGRLWVDCCHQSFARNPTRALSRRARLRAIERCVRTRARHG